MYKQERGTHMNKITESCFMVDVFENSSRHSRSIWKQEFATISEAEKEVLRLKQRGYVKVKITKLF